MPPIVDRGPARPQNGARRQPRAPGSRLIERPQPPTIRLELSMSHQYGPPPQPRPVQPQKPPRKTNSGCAFIVALCLILATGFGCYSLGRGDRASNRVTVAETVTARSTVTVTVTNRPRARTTRAAKPARTRTAEPASRPTRQPTGKPRRTQPPVESGVHPGAFCSHEGALGRTVKGTLMRCLSKPGDRARWRAA